MSPNDEILDAALHLAYEHGFDGLRIGDVGHAAGLTGPAIYRYVGRKRDILQALFDEALDGLLVRVGHPTGTPAEQLAAIVRAHLAFTLDNIELLTVYVREDRALEPASRRRLHERERDYRRRWTEALAAARPELSRDEATALVAAAIGMIGSMAYWPETSRRYAARSPLLEQMVLGLLYGRDKA